MSDIPSFQSLYTLMILLPGFVTYFIERGFIYQKNESSILMIAKSLVYSFITYTAFSFLNKPLISGNVTVLENGAKKYTINNDWLSFLLLFLISVILGGVIGILKTKDLHMKFFRKIGFTRRTSRNSIWLDVFHDKYSLKKEQERILQNPYGAYVKVFLLDGRSIFGWPEYFSDDFYDGPVLFLTNAVWIGEEGEITEIPYPGILVNGSEIKFIQFKMNKEDDNG